MQKRGDLKVQKEIIEYVKKTKNPYIIKIGDMNVKIIYSECNKTFNECIINILKQRLKYL